MEDFEVRVPPHDKDAELYLLGCLLWDEDTARGLLPQVEPGDFYTAKAGLIWQAARELVDAQTAINAITVADHLAAQGSLEEAGGYKLLMHRATDLVPTAANAEAYADIVRRHAQTRRLQESMRRTLEASYQTDNPAELAAGLYQAAINVLEGRRTEIGTVADMYQWWADRYEKRDLPTPPGPRVIPTGLRYLDRLLRMRATELTIACGRPASGKSLFAWIVGAQAALTGQTVAAFSLEMDREPLYERLVAWRLGIPLRDVQEGKIPELLWADSFEKVTGLAGMPFYPWFSRSLTSWDVVAACTALHYRLRQQGKGIDLVLVDYLTLLGDQVDKGGRSDLMWGRVVKRLRQMAKDLHCHVLLLAQLNREIEKRNDPRPRASDLKESGDLEQDADNILGLYWPDRHGPPPKRKGYDPDDQVFTDKLGVLILKQRNGPPVPVWLAIEAEKSTVRDLIPQEWPRM